MPGEKREAFRAALRAVRTIADLADSERIAPEHVAEAIQFRSFDFGE